MTDHTNDEQVERRISDAITGAIMDTPWVACGVDDAREVADRALAALHPAPRPEATTGEREVLGGCPFCDRIERSDVEQMFAGGDVVRFEPLNPVTPGHMLFIPGDHATHPDHEAMRTTIAYAERYAGQRGEDYNLITSHGPASSMTIEHIHVHYVPLGTGDGLTLPWSTRTPHPDVLGEGEDVRVTLEAAIHLEQDTGGSWESPEVETYLAVRGVKVLSVVGRDLGNYPRELLEDVDPDMLVSEAIVRAILDRAGVE